MSLYLFEPLISLLLSSARASVLMVSQLVLIWFNEGILVTGRYGVLGTEEKAYIMALIGAIKVE
jgi:hypothetical protein